MGTRPPWEDYSAAPEAGGEAPPWADYQAETPPLLGGGGATMSAGKPEEGFWQHAGRMLQAAIMGRPGEIAADPKLREAYYGHPDREEAKETGVAMQPTPAEMVDTAMAGAMALEGGGLAARGVMGGVKGATAAGAAARRVGVRGAVRGLADVVESPMGVAARGLRKLAERGAPAAEEAAAGGKVLPMPRLASDGPRTLRVPEGMPSLPSRGPAAVPSAAEAQAAEVQAKIISLRQEHGLSGAQITSSLRQLYGIPPSQGQKLVDMVLESATKVPR